MRQLPLPPTDKKIKSNKSNKPEPKKTSKISVRRWPRSLSILIIILILFGAAAAAYMFKVGDESNKTGQPSNQQNTKQAKLGKNDQSAGDNSGRSTKPTQSNLDFTFPGGKKQRTLTGNYRFVALYGTPNSAELGILGHQSLDKSVTRVKKLAAKYKPHSRAPIYPTFEIITTVASGSPTENNDYSLQIDASKIEPWVEKAKQCGLYVTLDLQPGRSNFLSQAKQHKTLLSYPNVGLALDPEWRLQPGQVPLEQIGSVSAAEVNETINWLADFVKDNNLPQKLLLLHQFRLDMLPDRAKINTSRSELSYIIQMDGQGSQPQKQATWQATLQSPLPAGTAFGWKNFYSKDKPTLTPKQTMAIKPQPWYISYQ